MRIGKFVLNEFLGGVIMNIRKAAAALTAVVLALSPATLASAAPADRGAVLYTDIRAYINGVELPYYLMDTSTAAVAVTDLTNYGFDLLTNAQAKTVTLTFNPNKVTSALPTVEAAGRVGAQAYRFFSTDWKVYIQGKAVPCYNIAGRLSVAFSALDVFGSRMWDQNTKTTKLTVKQNQQPAPSPSAPTPVPSGQYSITGIVRNADNGAVSDALVSFNVSGRSALTARTSAAGGYNIHNVPAGSTGYISVTATGYGDATTEPFTVNGNITSKNVTLSSKGTVTGKVTASATGAAVPNATVRLAPSSGSYTSVATDSNGNYSFTGVASGSYTITVTAAGYGEGSASTFNVSNASVTKNVSLPPLGAVVTGTVYVPGGLYVDTSSVTVRLIDGYGTAFSESKFVSFPSSAYSSVTSSPFSLQVNRTFSGTVTLRVQVTYNYSSSGYLGLFEGTTTATSNPLTVTGSSSTIQAGQISLSNYGNIYSISGTVYGISAGSRARVYISGTPDGGVAWAGVNGVYYAPASGYIAGGTAAFTIPSVPNGTYQVYAVDEITGAYSQYQTVTVYNSNNSSVVLNIAGSGYGVYTISGYVSGIPVGYRAVISISSTSGVNISPTWYGAPSNNGVSSFTISNVPNGSYSLWAQIEGGVGTSSTVPVTVSNNNVSNVSMLVVSPLSP
jgi:hypothetical protein